MKLISYKTWQKHHTGHLLSDGYRLCVSDQGYGLLKSSYPKDIASLIIHETFPNGKENDYEFVYWTHPYKGVKNLDDHIEIWCKKIK